jgi:hypothetical protein
LAIGSKMEGINMITISDLIKELQKIGIYRFEQLNNQMLEIPSVLLNEWKRLSLLSKKDAEWKMSSGN